jgi:hypothetical protein
VPRFNGTINTIVEDTRYQLKILTSKILNFSFEYVGSKVPHDLLHAPLSKTFCLRVVSYTILLLIMQQWLEILG